MSTTAFARTIPPGTTVGGPTFNRGTPTPTCTQVAAGLRGSAVAYRAIPFTVTVAGTYTIGTQYPVGFDGFISLYQGTFNPAASCANRIAFNDSFDADTNSQIANQTLAAGGYVLVVTGYANTDAGPYTGRIDGSGAVAFGVPSTIPASTTAGGPRFNRGSSSVPCTQLPAGTAGSAVSYRAIPFTVTAAGTYTITTVYPAGFDGYINLYQGTFDPAASCTNRIAFNDNANSGNGVADDVSSEIANQALPAGDYVLVVTAFSIGGGPYNGTIDGPAAVSFPAPSTIPAGTTVGGPTFNRGTSDPCAQVAAGGAGSAVAYRAIPFTVTVAGTYTITTQYPAGFDGYINLYQGTFNPAASCTNRIAFNDDSISGATGSQIASPLLAAGGSYVLVVTAFSNTSAGTYTGTIAGPGAASFGGASTIPPGTTVGGPRFNRATGTVAACTQVAAGDVNGSDVAYRAIPFTVAAASTYTITTQYPVGFDGYINLYQGTFNPAASCTNRIAFSDDFGSGTTASQIANQALAAGGYVLVVTGFGNGHAGSYTGTIDGPGAVSFPVVQAGLYNPTSAPGDGRGYRLLGAPVAGLTPTSLAALNLVQGIPAGTNTATHPAQYALAGPNLYTVYTGLGYTRPDADDPLVPGRGFFWQLYDQTIASANVPPQFGTGTSSSRELTGFALSATGTSPTADVQVAFADNTGAGTDNFQMLANPFAQPLAVSGITASGGTLQGGVVQAYNPNGRTFVLRMGADRLAVWQGVFAELVPAAPGGAVTVTYAFASTDTNAPPTFYGRGVAGVAEAAARPSVRFALAGTLADGTAVADSAAVVRFDGAATAGWDALDASKLTPPAEAYALVAPSTLRDGAAYRLAVDSRPLAAARVPLSFTTTAAGQFALSWTFAGQDSTGTLPAGWAATLTDTATGAVVDLAQATGYAFTANAATDWSERFVLAVTPRGATAGDESGAVTLALSAARPNPTTGAASLVLSLPEAADVRVAVYDVLGREVAVLADGQQAAGETTVRVAAGALATGTYVVRATVGQQVLTQRLTVVR